MYRVNPNLRLLPTLQGDILESVAAHAVRPGAGAAGAARTLAGDPRAQAVGAQNRRGAGSTVERGRVYMYICIYMYVYIYGAFAGDPRAEAVGAQD